MGIRSPIGNRSVWLVWSILTLASLAGFFFAELKMPIGLAATFAMLLAAYKIHLIFDHYMELSWRHWPLRHFLAAWLVISVLVILVPYWITKGVL